MVRDRRADGMGRKSQAPPGPTSEIVGPAHPRASTARRRQTLRVATAGGTRDARNAGPSTASWPSAHRHRNPTGT